MDEREQRMKAVQQQRDHAEDTASSLSTELEQARAELTDARETLADVWVVRQRLETERDAARREIGRLREALERIDALNDSCMHYRSFDPEHCYVCSTFTLAKAALAATSGQPAAD